MHSFIPYLVILGVIIAFFLICYFVFREPAQKASSLSEEHRADRRRKVREYAKGTGTAADLVSSEPTRMPTEEAHKKAAEEAATVAVSSEDLAKTKTADGLSEQKSDSTQTSAVADGYGSVSIHEGTPEAMTMVLSPVEDTGKEGAAVDNLAVTQPLAGLSTVAGSEDATAPTLILRRDELNAALANQELMESAPVQETEPVTDYSVSPWKLASQEQERVNIALEPFMHSFGVISTRTREVVEEVTRDALQELGLTSNEEVRALLDNIVVQEALLYMQKAYAANPAEWMRPIAVDAFVDVVTQPKSSTPYLVAFDALKILSNLTLAHLQVMAITLLLQYSRNSNNYSLEHFRHYVDKYIQPFVSDLPRGDEVFRQLDYLRCTQDESEKITLMQLLSNSYSFVFNFRGFTKDELYRVLDGEELDSRFVVKSLNSALYKLALVDEAMAPRFFRQAKIMDSRLQSKLMHLMKSKPTAFHGSEARRVLDTISPTLLDLADLFDNSTLSTMSLTLLGLYIGKSHVKATIHEEFDLSQWF